jgi:adenosylcobinamide-GDP ribazoletransferase
MRPFLAAVQFLTVFPLPVSLKTDERDLEKSIYYFPIVGLLLGILAAALDYGLGFLLPKLAGSVLVVIALLLMNGGLHLDGLADTADAFFSSRSRERMLEIMKDSRTGPMGVTAIVCVLVLKIALLASITGAIRWQVIIIIPLAGRCALLIMLSLLPYARPEGGLCSVFLRKHSPVQVVWVLIFLLGAGYFMARWLGLAAGLSAVAMTLLISNYTYRKIGGLTGDTLGATCEIAEIMPSLVAAIWIFRGSFS